MNTTFTIDTQNNVARHDSGSEIPEGSAAFSSEADLATLSERWPATRLVNIWNALPGVQPVRRFTDRKTAVRRIWALLDKSAPASPEPKSRKSQTVSKPNPAAGTKPPRVIALLRRPEGATLKALLAATGWQPH